MVHASHTCEWSVKLFGLDECPMIPAGIVNTLQLQRVRVQPYLIRAGIEKFQNSKFQTPKEKTMMHQSIINQCQRILNTNDEIDERHQNKAHNKE